MVWVLETLASKSQDGRQDMGADNHKTQMPDARRKDNVETDFCPPSKRPPQRQEARFTCHLQEVIETWAKPPGLNQKWDAVLQYGCV